MKVVDTNVLLYAVNPMAPDHAPSIAWLDGALRGGATVGFSWMALLGFIRIATARNIFPTPLTAHGAMDRVDAWLAQPGAAVIEPTARHASLLRELLAEAGSAGNLTSDAHLAALSIEHHGSVVSFDRDFQRFDRVRWELPS